MTKDLDDVDEFSDSLINNLYNNLVPASKQAEIDDPLADFDTVPEKQTKKPTTGKVTKNKAQQLKKARPTTAGYKPPKGMPLITEVGKKASSRLFDYQDEHRQKLEKRHEELKAKSIQQLKKAADEKKKDIDDKRKQIMKSERKKLIAQMSEKERMAMKSNLQADQKLQDEMMQAMSMVKKALKN